MSQIMYITHRYRVRSGDTDVKRNYTIGADSKLRILRGDVDITANCTIVMSGGTAMVTIPVAQLGTLDDGYSELITYEVTDNSYSRVNSAVTIAELSTVSTGKAYKLQGALSTVQVVLAGTGTFSATVKVQVSNNGIDWFEAGSATLDNTTLTEGFYINAKWAYVRAKVTAISGTGALATVIVNS